MKPVISNLVETHRRGLTYSKLILFLSIALILWLQLILTMLKLLSLLMTQWKRNVVSYYLREGHDIYMCVAYCISNSVTFKFSSHSRDLATHQFFRQLFATVIITLALQ